VSPSTHAALLAACLVLTAVTGPWMLRRAAPALMRTPRLALALLLGTVAAWLATLLALGPVLAWVVTGPALLPGGSGEVCRRCLAAANPSGGPLLDTAVPVVLLLALPAAAVVFQAVAASREALHRRSATRSTARRLRSRGRFQQICGQRVLIVEDPHPFALALPRRHGGIVVSSAALDLLAPQELAAVVTHERAHVQQRHHLLAALMQAATSRMRWVPLLAAAADAFGHYQEIAADDLARRRVGTPALAGALLLLGQRATSSPDLHGALHALGPDRVRHLVQRGSGTAGVVSTVLAAGCLTALAVVGFAVHVPYAAAALTGCS